ncbi:MAG: undecaprenyl-phosphate glucose phosphotransferase [Proteobacteria bacterium]|nr:undecaprenyl-phosphate glucose phosphotransferase [Pseudomonadota bacterium]
MLKQNSKFFENLLFIADLSVITAAWFVSYHLRFISGLIPTHKGVADFATYMVVLIPIYVIWAFVFKAFGLYRPKRATSRAIEVLDLAKACILSALLLVVLTYFFRQYEFSRLVFILFTIISVVALSVERVLFREFLRYIRRRGYNQKHALVVGTGATARNFIANLDDYPQVGIVLDGVISVDSAEVGTEVEGVKVIGAYGELGAIIRERKIDSLFIALAWEEQTKVERVLLSVGDEMVDINVIPALLEFVTLSGGIDEFCGLPLLKLQGSSLYGWNLVIKRVADVLFSLILILLSCPVMLVVAALIKLTSPGPVLYIQERMGIGGETFNMYKFRSMRADAEAETGAVWAVEKDSRRTLVGRILRSTSLDELPQFFNVLKGDMSLVGPRPERPAFIKDFRKRIPKYMLRHKVKSGITGWAQVNGWRGNTDINRRVEHDIYYIEHWSPWFDLRIMLMTVWRGLINRNAY